MPRFMRNVLAAAVVAAILLPRSAEAAAEVSSGTDVALTLLLIVVIIVIAKAASLVERLGQPAVLGELIAGVILGNLVLLGFPLFEPIKNNAMIRFLAELGVVILLFQVGLETNIDEMRRVGLRAFFVACVGVAVPFALATILIGPMLLPGLSMNTYLFLGATLTATSVGITARVFRDLGKLQTPEAQIVLGAAVIDDVLGLIILGVVSALVTVGSISVGVIIEITVKAVVFLVAAVILGRLLVPHLGRLLSRIQTNAGMKFTFAIGFGLVTAFFAGQIGLAPIVGAFAAGMVLDPVHFRWFQDPQLIQELTASIADADPKLRERIGGIIAHHSERHVEDLIAPVGYLLVPIFFVLTGMDVHVETLFNVHILLVALGMTAVAFAGKIASGLVAGPVNKWIVGWGMIPRGEVGLIFAATGKAMGIVTDEIYSVIVIVVILSTLVTPPILSVLLKRKTQPPLSVPRPATIGS